MNNIKRRHVLDKWNLRRYFEVLLLYMFRINCAIHLSALIVILYFCRSAIIIDFHIPCLLFIIGVRILKISFYKLLFIEIFVLLRYNIKNDIIKTAGKIDLYE